MSSIDEKFQKVIAEKTATPEETVKEDAAVATQLLKKVQFHLNHLTLRTMP